MATIRYADLVQSVADALQFISYYHPADYLRALGRAYEREQSPAARDAIAQTVIHITFLISALAIAASDRIMPQPQLRAHGKDHGVPPGLS